MAAAASAPAAPVSLEPAASNDEVSVDHRSSVEKDADAPQALGDDGRPAAPAADAASSSCSSSSSSSSDADPLYPGSSVDEEDELDQNALALLNSVSARFVLEDERILLLAKQRSLMEFLLKNLEGIRTKATPVRDKVCETAEEEENLLLLQTMPAAEENFGFIRDEAEKEGVYLAWEDVVDWCIQWEAETLHTLPEVTAEKDEMLKARLIELKWLGVEPLPSQPAEPAAEPSGPLQGNTLAKSRGTAIDALLQQPDTGGMAQDLLDVEAQKEALHAANLEVAITREIAIIAPLSPAAEPKKMPKPLRIPPGMPSFERLPEDERNFGQPNTSGPGSSSQSQQGQPAAHAQAHAAAHPAQPPPQDTPPPPLCKTEGCLRHSWNGEQGVVCCRTCWQSVPKGKWHGKTCNRWWECRLLEAAAAEASDAAAAASDVAAVREADFPSAIAVMKGKAAARAKPAAKASDAAAAAAAASYDAAAAALLQAAANDVAAGEVAMAAAVEAAKKEDNAAENERFRLADLAKKESYNAFRDASKLDSDWRTPPAPPHDVAPAAASDVEPAAAPDVAMKAVEAAAAAAEASDAAAAALFDVAAAAAASDVPMAAIVDIHLPEAAKKKDKRAAKKAKRKKALADKVLETGIPNTPDRNSSSGCSSMGPDITMGSHSDDAVDIRTETLGSALAAAVADADAAATAATAVAKAAAVISSLKTSEPPFDLATASAVAKRAAALGRFTRSVAAQHPPLGSPGSACFPSPVPVPPVEPAMGHADFVARAAGSTYSSCGVCGVPFAVVDGVPFGVCGVAVGHSCGTSVEPPPAAAPSAPSSFPGAFPPPPPRSAPPPAVGRNFEEWGENTKNLWNLEKQARQLAKEAELRQRPVTPPEDPEDALAEVAAEPEVEVEEVEARFMQTFSCPKSL